ncbi:MULTISPECIES: nitroreductase/quinone reductase family protein [unclassified Saccharothrix]|uniref:nitroreductase/quinone reductase family protein n=1 Tax=unclassified Saccharothrix TaxID=2593673 RepID=UPI00307FA4FE
MTEERRAQDQRVIEDFRANGGVTEGRTLLLLHHVGAKSGIERVTPLRYLSSGDRWVVAAGNGGLPPNPGWYYNVLAQPSVVVEIGTETLRATARVAEGDEREELAEMFRNAKSRFSAFEKALKRQIPIVVFERA